MPAWIAEEAVVPPGHRLERQRTPLVGRDAEVGLLHHAVGAAVHHSRAALVLLVGEAGVGKSRLAEELATWAAESHDALVLEGRCVPYGEANVWWPVADAIRHSVGISSTDSEEVGTDLALLGVRRASARAPARPRSSGSTRGSSTSSATTVRCDRSSLRELTTRRRRLCSPSPSATR